LPGARADETRAAIGKAKASPSPYRRTPSTIALRIAFSRFGGCARITLPVRTPARTPASKTSSAAATSQVATILSLRNDATSKSPSASARRHSSKPAKR
jgi:hypothetical protein